MRPAETFHEEKQGKAEVPFEVEGAWTMRRKVFTWRKVVLELIGEGGIPAFHATIQ